jgi:hypothetical protein
MVTLDLLDFALHGRLGPFHRQMSRADIESILGPSDDCYPALVAFGHVSFDLGDGIGPPCAPQIQFPAWYREDRVPEWPDPRFNWCLGPFDANATLDSILIAIPSLCGLDLNEGTRYPNGRMGGIYIPTSGVELTFESRPGDMALRLTLMAAYYNWTIEPSMQR